jgi:diguanylate cyclase (GGDEF)-like protein
MKKNTHISENLKLMTKDMFTRQDMVRYNISMAIIASFLIAISTLSIFLFDLLITKNFEVSYLMMTLIMIPLMFIYMYIYSFSNKLNIIQTMLLNLFPYAVISSGAYINYKISDNMNMIPPFLLVIISISYIQLLTIPRIIRIYSFTYFTLFLLNYSIYGFNIEFISNFIIGTIIISYACFFSYIQTKAHQNNKKISHELESLNENQSEYIKKLTKVHQELQQNNTITEAMMKMSTEIIKLNQFDQVLQLIMDEAIKLIPKAQSGSILIYNGSEMEFRAVSGYDFKVLSQIRLKLDSLYQSTLEDMFEPAIITNLEVFDEGKLNGDQFNQMKDNGALVAKSILTCCFKYEGNLFGCINLDNFESQTVFNDSDKKLIKHLTKQIEVAVTIHNLYDAALKPTRYDTLTQIYSRRYMDFILNKSFSEATLNEKPISVCAIDLNDLKYVNDLLGHDSGDQYLKYFVETARSTLPTTTILARVGGDEFIFGFPGQTKSEVEKDICLIRKYLKANPFKSSGVKRQITFGCGVASYPNDSNNLDELLKIADSRMYKDKTQFKTPNEETQLL